MMIMLLFDREGPIMWMIILNQFKRGGAVACDKFSAAACAQR